MSLSVYMEGATTHDWGWLSKFYIHKTGSLQLGVIFVSGATIYDKVSEYLCLILYDQQSTQSDCAYQGREISLSSL